MPVFYPHIPPKKKINKKTDFQCNFKIFEINEKAIFLETR